LKGDFMDVAITASSPGAVSSSPNSGPSVTNLDNARALQARQDQENAQRKLDEQRAEAARQAQATQSSRNSNGEVIGTTISTTA
jgi:hypothetical protein